MWYVQGILNNSIKCMKENKVNQKQKSQAMFLEFFFFFNKSKRVALKVFKQKSKVT